MRARLDRWLAIGFLAAAVPGCASVLVEEEADETSSDVEDSGTLPNPAAEPTWQEACPDPSGLVPQTEPGGKCSNEPGGGTLTLERAEELLFRITHEAWHLASLGVTTDREPFAGETGGVFEDYEDQGYMLVQWGAPNGTSTCAALAFKCWTGGHGSWGPNALAGTALVNVTTENDRATRVHVESDSLWLVEDAPLVGTPQAKVSVDMKIVDGMIDSVVATVGDHPIER